jgi:hypothetical protein
MDDNLDCRVHQDAVDEDEEDDTYDHNDPFGLAFSHALC